MSAIAARSCRQGWKDRRKPGRDYGVYVWNHGDANAPFEAFGLRAKDVRLLKKPKIMKRAKVFVQMHDVATHSHAFVHLDKSILCNREEKVVQWRILSEELE